MFLPFYLIFGADNLGSVLLLSRLHIICTCVTELCDSTSVCHWPAPDPAACQPSPCPARPAGTKAAPGGREPWMSLWRKCGASPSSSQDNYCCLDSCLVYTAANFLCSFKPNCCRLEEPSTVCLSNCPPCSICLRGHSPAYVNDKLSVLQVIIDDSFEYF